MLQVTGELQFQSDQYDVKLLAHDDQLSISFSDWDAFSYFFRLRNSTRLKQIKQTNLHSKIVQPVAIVIKNKHHLTIYKGKYKFSSIGSFFQLAFFYLKNLFR